MILKAFLLSGILAMASTFVYKPLKIVKDNNVNNIINTQKTENNTIGKQIRIVRESKQISREALAEALQIDVAQLRSIEQGSVSPQKKIVFKIEEILETTFLSDN